MLDLRGRPDPGLHRELRARDRHERESAGADGPRDPVLAATAEAIRRAMAGESADAPRLQPTPTPAPQRKRGRSAPRAKAAPKRDPGAERHGRPGALRPACGARPAPSATPAPPGSGDEPLLDYLFGKDTP